MLCEGRRSHEPYVPSPDDADFHLAAEDTKMSGRLPCEGARASITPSGCKKTP
ncbi:hypothetical protein DB30_01376 [Enhygromyxa salina]|uniref:Uncharacterized protein n=1 Tax=Enhygromyxa salina TaxID=215803 RepID=A0A0C2DF62_9BACT|nr:hypothetical protein DB30_01376 [Enhygromyxa salina]